MPYAEKVAFWNIEKSDSVLVQALHDQQLDKIETPPIYQEVDSKRNETVSASWHIQKSFELNFVIFIC